jgi:hypothetical protein
MPEIVRSQIIIGPQKTNVVSSKTCALLPTCQSELLRTSGADHFGTAHWPISGLRAEDSRLQPSVHVGQRLEPIFPGSSGGISSYKSPGGTSSSSETNPAKPSVDKRPIQAIGFEDFSFAGNKYKHGVFFGSGPVTKSFLVTSELGKSNLSD